MNLLFEGAVFGLAFLLVRFVFSGSLRASAANFLKVAFTGRILWLLLTAPVADGAGEVVPAYKLIVDLVGSIDPVTFWTFILIGSAVRFGGVMASMYRWQLVLRGQGIELPFWHIFGAFLIGRVIGFFLPSTAGLDAYKLYDASRFSGRTVEVTAATALEKVLGVTGIFMTFLVALPMGMSIFGDNAMSVALITVPVALGIISALLAILWFPGLVQWVIENTPIPAKDRIQGLVMRLSNSAAAYRDKKGLVLLLLLLSFLLHFSTAVMYYFMALAVGAAGEALFWPIVFGSAIQIFATVIGPTIGGMGVREAAQVLTIGALVGPIVAGVSATLGFWVGEVPTLFGVFFWLARGKGYTPAYCRVDGKQVDYEEAAKQAVSLGMEDLEAETDDAAAAVGAPIPQPQRLLASAGAGLGAGVLAGIVIGLTEAFVIGAGGFGEDSQVLWFGPLVYALLLGGLGAVGGAVLSVLPMRIDEVRSWVPALGLTATLIPFGLMIAIFRLRRDVYLEQMPPVPVLLGVLGGAAVLVILLLTVGRRFFGSPAGAIARPLPAVGLLVVVMGLGALLGPAESPVQPPVRAEIPAHLQDKPNVVLVIVDTLRADHLGSYGDPRGLSPNIDAVAADGATWEAFGQSSWTKPSVATILTSLYASSHGAMSKPSVLPDVTTLADAMQEQGYTTSGFVSNINLAPSFNFQQGFDEYTYFAPDYLFGAEESSSKLVIYSILRVVNFKLFKDRWVEQYYQDSRTVNEDALPWIERHKDDRFFTLLHYMDPHDPYFTHPYDGKGIARVENQNPPAEDAAEMKELYAGEISYMDESFGHLVEQLKSLDLYGNTLIILTADHGEEFQEHGGWWHGTTLYNEQIAVPLITKFPAGTYLSGRPSGVARLLDVSPTILSAAGAPLPDEWQGADLSEGIPSARVAFAEEDHEGNIITAVRKGPTKLIRSQAGNPRGLPEVELFDVEGDPAEQRNLAADHEVEIADLDKEIIAISTGATDDAVETGGDVEMDDATRDRLRALGYIE
ncbi:MAG: sulfatase-like hydrolase/transferase [Candidatus Binatia bacterium]|nr:sulfatase-like hydrolase/transferase [Candidatus Binatia bacterium]